MKTYNLDPNLKGTLTKVQDLLSTKSKDELIEKNFFWGVASGRTQVENVLDQLIEEHHLQVEVIQVCPSFGCESHLIEKDDQLFCEECNCFIEADEVIKADALRVINPPQKTDDSLWDGKSGLKQLFTLDTGNDVLGERDSDYIYLEKMVATESKTVLLRDGFEVLEIKFSYFQPEYGNQKRAYVYNYKIIKGATVNNQNMHNYGTVINPSQTINQNNGVTSDNLTALLAVMKDLAIQNNITDQKLLSALDEALLAKDKPTLSTKVNAVIAGAANYVTVFGPVFPQLVETAKNILT